PPPNRPLSAAPYHAPADGDCRAVPERAKPAPEPRRRDEDPPGAPLREGAARAGREAEGAGSPEDEDRLRQPDPLLCPPAVPDDQGPPDGNGGRRRRPRARRGSGSFHPRISAFQPEEDGLTRRSADAKRRT